MTLSMIYSFSFYPLIFPSLLSHRSWFLSHCLINLLNTEFCLGICFLESPYGKSKNNCEFFFPPLETSFDVIFTQTPASQSFQSLQDEVLASISGLCHLFFSSISQVTILVHFCPVSWVHRILPNDEL